MQTSRPMKANAIPTEATNTNEDENGSISDVDEGEGVVFGLGLGEGVIEGAGVGLEAGFTLAILK
jgi:hypothetical protein